MHLLLLARIDKQILKKSTHPIIYSNSKVALHCLGIHRIFQFSLSHTPCFLSIPSRLCCCNQPLFCHHRRFPKSALSLSLLFAEKVEETLNWNPMFLVAFANRGVIGLNLVGFFAFQWNVTSKGRLFCCLFNLFSITQTEK